MHSSVAELWLNQFFCYHGARHCRVVSSTALYTRFWMTLIGHIIFTPCLPGFYVLQLYFVAVLDFLFLFIFWRVQIFTVK